MVKPSTGSAAQAFAAAYRDMKHPIYKQPPVFKCSCEDVGRSVMQIATDPRPEVSGPSLAGMNSAIAASTMLSRLAARRTPSNDER